MRSGLRASLTPGGRWTFVGGKGGVGKTTVAAALAVELADAGEGALVLSTDPAHSLGDALGLALGPEPREVPGLPMLEALEVDAAYERARFHARHRDALAGLVERGTYLDEEDVREVSDLAIPGMDELAALLRLAHLAETYPGRVVIDTAPTGHTLRLLDLPREALDWMGALEAMQARHEAVASALAGSVPADRESAFLAEMRADLQRVGDLLHDPHATRFVLVTNPSPVVTAETRRYQDQLAARGIAPGGIVVNRQVGAPAAAATGGAMVFVPVHREGIVGVDGLRAFAASAAASVTEEHADAGAETDRPEGAAASGGAAEGGRLADGLEIRPGPSFEPPPDRRLYLVGGKGGVGKSTVAASLAITLVEDAGRRLLLLGVDPAGSLGDIFDLPIGDDPTPVPGVSGLTIRQLDPGRGWASLRDRYRTEVDHFFAGLLAGGGSASLDREVAERLIDLAPPGLDELVAIMEVIDSTEDRGYDALVLDAAPTGHLLRLLELPELGLDWCHAMLRLLLKYRGVVPLSGLGERVLELSRDLRRVRAWLSDPDRTWFLAVALPESLSLPESRRLLEGLAGLKMRPGALLVNRALDGQGRVSPDAAELAGALLSIDPTVPGALAPLAVTPLRGVAALREFAGAWRCAARDPAGGPAG